VREISLQPDITNPWHAVQLSSGQFVVSHWGPGHRVSVVGVDGRIVCSYGGSPGSGDKQLNTPRSLAVGESGCILVADQFNNRVVVMDSSLLQSHVLPLIIDGGLRAPWNLWLDQSHGRLYVGEYNGSRVSVFDNVTNSCRF
jgi:DNA-binding beta-propeller fold protein YncE